MVQNYVGGSKVAHLYVYVVYKKLLSDGLLVFKTGWMLHRGATSGLDGIRLG